MSASSEARAGRPSGTASTGTAATTGAPVIAPGPGPDATPADAAPADAAPAGNAGEDAVAIPVVLPADLHARPAGRLARAAAGFTSALVLQCGERVADPRGVLGVMALGATAGRTVIVRAQGPDAREAAASLAEILATAR